MSVSHEDCTSSDILSNVEIQFESRHEAAPRGQDPHGDSADVLAKVLGNLELQIDSEDECQDSQSNSPAHLMSQSPSSSPSRRMSQSPSSSNRRSFSSRYSQVWGRSLESARDGGCRSTISRLPASINGMSLGLCGLTGLWAKMGVMHHFNFDPICICLLSMSAILYTSYVPLKILTCYRTFKVEMLQPPVVSAIASIPMTTMLLGVQLFLRIDQLVGHVLVLIGGFCQLACMLHFLFLVIRQQIPPETYWFPPTVSIAVTAIAGKVCAWPLWAYQGCFYAAILIMLGTLPFVAYRVARYPKTVALGPTCNLLCAPASLNSLTWHLVNKPHWPGPANNWLGVTLFAVAMFFWAETILGLILRRAHWLGTRYSPAWAAFTFPLASTSQAILYAHEDFFPNSLVFEACHYAIFAFCNIVFLYTHLRFYISLPMWLKGVATPGAPHQAHGTANIESATLRDNPDIETEHADVVGNGILAAPRYDVFSSLGYEEVPLTGYYTHVKNPHSGAPVEVRARSHTISVGALQRGAVPTTEYGARTYLTELHAGSEEPTERPRAHSISVGALQAGHLPQTERQGAQSHAHHTFVDKLNEDTFFI